VTLRNVPADSLTAQAAARGLERAGWTVEAFAATPRPVLAAEGGEASTEAFAKEINKHSRVRGYANKLARQDGFEFEALEDGEGLEDWAADFCRVHDWRWAKTPTPSAYRSAQKRKLFLRTLGAWHADGSGVRFSIRVGGRRVAFVAAVRSGRRLVYHHVAVSPAGDELRAGHVMIRLIGLWMAERGLSELDFGVGDEGYKFRYANADKTLWKVYGAPSAASTVIVKAKAEQATLKSKRLGDAWKKFGPQGLTGNVAAQVSNLRDRARVAVRYYGGAPWLVRLAGVGRALKLEERELMFRSVGRGEPLPSPIREVGVFEVLDMVEEVFGLTARGRAVYHRLWDDGGRVYGIRNNGKLVHFEWLTQADPAEVPAFLGAAEGRPVWQITRCLTRPESRGQRLYPTTIRGITASLPAGDPCLIWTHTWNHASIRGILKAGFEPFASRTWKGGGPRTCEPYRAEAPQGVPLGDWVLRNLP
jgi:hypothetical protein